MTILHTHAAVTFGRQLRAWRRRHGYSQGVAAIWLGVPVRTIEAWEQGVRRPGIHTLAELIRQMAERDKSLHDGPIKL